MKRPLLIYIYSIRRLKSVKTGDTNTELKTIENKIEILLTTCVTEGISSIERNKLVN